MREMKIDKQIYNTHTHQLDDFFLSSKMRSQYPCISFFFHFRSRLPTKEWILHQ